MARKPVKKPARTLKQAEARIKALETLCADLYQVVGVAGAPVRVLDAAFAAAMSKPIPRVTLLPIMPLDFDEVVERERELRAYRKLEKTTRKVMKAAKKRGLRKVVA